MGTKRGTPKRLRISKGNLIYRGVPRDYISINLNFIQDKEKFNFFDKYINNIHDMYEDNMNLILYGANGTGKTALASIIVREAYINRYSSALTTFSEYMDLVFTRKDLEYLNYIQRAEFLILDEVGKENFTKTGGNINLLESILRQASNNGQVVIICTNLPLEGEGGLYDNYGKSIASLIKGNFLKVCFTGEDYRGQITKSKKALELLQ